MSQPARSQMVASAANSIRSVALLESPQTSRYIGYAVRRAQLRIDQSFYDALAGMHVTPPRFTLLLLIRDNPGCRSVDLARALGIAPSGMVKLIEGFEREQLILRETSPVDRRNHAIFLTDAGRQRLQVIEQAVETHERKIAGRLSAQERQQLFDLLARLGR